MLLAAMPIARKARVLAAVALAFPLASGEIFKFDQRPLPGPYSLQGLAAFTLYAPGDSPKKNDGGERPFVEYRDIQAHSTAQGQADSSLDTYKSIQMTLISEEDYEKHIAQGPICNSMDQLETKSAPGVTMHTVYFTKTETEHVEVNKTGTYFLLVSNCGNFSSGVINGNVAVRNPFGYASGTDYHKMVSYGYFFGIYIVMALVWGLLCVMWKSELIAMHGVVGLVLALGLVEAGAWYYYLSNMNQTGIVGESMVCVLVMFTVLTTYTSYTFILVVSQGWRMTEEVLDDCMLCKMAIFGLIWVVASYLREGAMTHRQAYHISTKFMTMTLVPNLVVNLLILAWIFLSLGKLSKTLQERSLNDQLKAISRFTTGLAIAVAVGSLVAVVQLLDSSGSLQLGWEYQFLVDGGLSHVIFISMLGLSMFVWMPSAGSAQLGYAPPVDQEDDGLWKEGGDDENGGGNKIMPDTVGAADEDL